MAGGFCEAGEVFSRAVFRSGGLGEPSWLTSGAG